MMPTTSDCTRCQTLCPPSDAVNRLASELFGNQTVTGTQLLPEGLRNFNYKVDFDSHESTVIRVYGLEPSAIDKEVNLLQALAGTGVLVPEILQVHKAGLNGLGPFIVYRYVGGINFRQLKKTHDMRAIAQAAYSTGETLALIAQPSVYQHCAAVENSLQRPFLPGANAICEAIDSCLDSPVLAQRLGEQVRDQLRVLVWRHSAELAGLENELRLGHGDFGNRNVLVAQTEGHWRVSSIIDWEFAFASPPLFDVGSFLRYEPLHSQLREPHFSQGYTHAGGILPDNWRRLAQIVDLVRQCRTLTEPYLPEIVVDEVSELVRQIALHN